MLEPHSCGNPCCWIIHIKAGKEVQCTQSGANIYVYVHDNIFFQNSGPAIWRIHLPPVHNPHVACLMEWNSRHKSSAGFAKPSLNKASLSTGRPYKTVWVFVLLHMFLLWVHQNRAILCGCGGDFVPLPENSRFLWIPVYPSLRWKCASKWQCTILVCSVCARLCLLFPTSAVPKEGVWSRVAFKMFIFRFSWFSWSPPNTWICSIWVWSKEDHPMLRLSWIS